MPRAMNTFSPDPTWPPWVARTRWAEAAVLLAACQWGAFPWVPGVAGLVWMAAGNALLQRTPRLRVQGALLGILLGDTAVLTWLLAQSGGPANPFSTVLLVNVSLAALLLRPLAFGMVGVVAAASYGLLFRTVDMASLHGPGAFEDHLRGMWLSFVLSGLLIGSFVLLTRRALERAQDELARLRDRNARMDRLAALSTLAAGAAHELGTPLSSIRSASGELQRALGHLPQAREFAPELEAIRTSVERCRDILGRLSRSGGQHSGESVEHVPLHRVWERALPHLAAEAQRVDAAVPTEAMVRVPPNAAQEVLKNVIHNALEAAPAPARVALTCVRGRQGWEVAVHDVGPGLPDAVRERLGEPFVTTKPDGMGLGLYLADQMCRQCGGELRVETPPGGGTRVVMVWPAE